MSIQCDVCGRDDRNPDQVELTWGPFSGGVVTLCDPSYATEDDPECEIEMEITAAMRRRAWNY